MNTSEGQNQPSQSAPAPQAAENTPAPAQAADAITGLVGDLQTVDSSSPQAAQNETTISDNNGDRITLGEDGTNGNIIRK